MSPEYLIGELAEKSGVSVRTIRYYISEGLLPSPDIRGRYSMYDEGYLKRIQLIKRLKDAYLPIKEIKHKLETQTEAELEEFLTLFKEKNAGQDALDYIQNISAQPKLMKKAPSPSPMRMSAARVEEKAAAPIYPSPEEIQWVRIKIMDGVELHIQQSKYSSVKGKLTAVIEGIKDKLGR